MDLTDSRIGKTLVLKQEKPRWICRCDCGAIFVATEKRLLGGYVRACPKCTRSGDYPHVPLEQRKETQRERLKSSVKLKPCATEGCDTVFEGNYLAKFCSECRKQRMREQQKTSKKAIRQLIKDKGGKK